MLEDEIRVNCKFILIVSTPRGMLVEMHSSRDTEWSRQTCPQPSTLSKLSWTCSVFVKLFREFMFNLRSGWEYRNIHEMLSVEDGATHTPLHRESTLSGEGRWWRGMRWNQGAEGHLLWSPWSWHGEEWLKQQPQQTERNHKSGRRNQRGRNPSKCKKPAEGKEQGSAGFPSTKIHRKQFIHRTL